MDLDKYYKPWAANRSSSARKIVGQFIAYVKANEEANATPVPKPEPKRRMFRKPTPAPVETVAPAPTSEEPPAEE